MSTIRAKSNPLEPVANSFHKPSQGHYFLTHSIGLMPISSDAFLKDNYFRHWQSGGEEIWPVWLDEIELFNRALANLLNSSPEQFCPQVNVSSGLSKVIQSLPESNKRNTILATESDFPSAGFVLQQARRLGLQVRLIPKGEDLQSLEVWEAALTSDIHSAFITHVHYNTNKRIPVQSINEICRDRGIMSIVDIAQSVGIVPIDFQAFNADIVIGSCIKWLCGGPGAGFLWVDKDLIEELNPIDVGWFSHKNPFEFDINNFAYADSTARFWGGTPSVIPYVVARNSIETIAKIGVETLLQHNQRLSQKIMDKLPEDCIASPLDLDKKGGTLVLKFPDSEKVEQALKDKKIIFDARQYGIRLSPHLYTSDEDVGVLIDGFI